jgi:hypothetical protein
MAATVAFNARPAQAAPAPAACAANSENRQLDYWIGDWDVTTPGTSNVSTSKIHFALDKCLVVEHWGGAERHSGENFLGYSADDKSWHGLFADNRGRVHVFVDGKVEGGTAEFSGQSHGPNGESVLNRVTIVRKSADKVEQTWEKSTDSGATWTAVYRGEYSRHKP